VRRVFVSGLAISVPVIVTALVLTFVVNFVRGLVGPAASFTTDVAGVGQSIPDYALEVTAVAVVVVSIFLVGVVAESPFGADLESAFDRGMSSIPGLGSVYTSFDEMSDLLLSGDSQSFREVKLVEFPTDSDYCSDLPVRPHDSVRSIRNRPTIITMRGRTPSLSSLPTLPTRSNEPRTATR
jgi:uncharacterized membrane protein